MILGTPNGVNVHEDQFLNKFDAKPTGELTGGQNCSINCSARDHWESQVQMAPDFSIERLQPQ